MVRKGTAGDGMKPLTNYKVKKKVGVRRYGCHWLNMTWYYSQPVKPMKTMGVRRVRRYYCTWMELLTDCQAIEWGKLQEWEKRQLNSAGMGSLTSYQANKMRVRVKTVRGATAELGMKTLTNCQTNQIRVEIRTMKMDITETNEITHFLSSQANNGTKVEGQ